MLDILEKGVATARGMADYIELRGEERVLTYITYSDGRIDNVSSIIHSGVGCRVLYDGAWGFSCGRMDALEHLVRDTCSLARAASYHRKERIELQDINPQQDERALTCRTPPHHVALERKISRLKTVHDLIRVYDPRIGAVSIDYEDSHGTKCLVTSEGTALTQETSHLYNHCWVTGKESGALTAARDITGSTEEGFEFFEKESEERIAERVCSRVIMQLNGRIARKGTFPCVLGSRVVGILAHEALGHLVEADLTGSSPFNNRLGKKVSTDSVNVVDAPVKGTFGSTSYDDEGVPTGPVDIIKNGVLCGLLTNREYAFKTGIPVCGAARAESFLYPPLIRMRNTFFDCGDLHEEELLEGIRFGYYCKDFRGGEADLSSWFQIGIQEAFEIVNGEIGDPVKEVSISGLATEALLSIEGIGNTLEFLGGYCGKGQQAAVSAGGPPLRFPEGVILFGGRMP